MYPNQGQPNSGYPGYGQYPSMPQPFGAGYPQPGMPQPGYPSMPQQGMPQPYGQQSMGYPGQQMGQPMGQPMGYPGQQMGQPMGQPPMAYPGQPGQPPMGQQQQQFGYPGQQPPMAQPGQQPPMAQPGQQPPMAQAGYQPPMTQAGYPTQQATPGAYADPMVQRQSQPQYQQYGAPPPQQQAPYGAPGAFSYTQPGQYMSAAPSQGRPTVTPAPNFNASNDAAALRKAMKGFGTDEDGIINILCKRTNNQRMEIVRAFKTAYGKDLHSDIRSEISGNFETLMIALLTPTIEYYCREIYEAVSGAGTDEDVLIEVMCALSNREIREISNYYHRMFGRSLEQELGGDTSGSFRRLMVSLSNGNRDESMMTDLNSARMDAQELKSAGVDKWGTDESAFNRIFCVRNYEQLKLICKEYEKLAGNSLEKDVKKEFSGDIEDGLLAIIRCANNRSEFFARRLHKSMAGLGTNDRSLIRLVATRCELDMMDIKEEFQRYYGKSLKSFIKGDTSGHYKHALYQLIAENRS